MSLVNVTARMLTLGIGTLALAPLILTAAAARPINRAAARAGMIVYEKSRETAVELGQVAEELITDTQSRLKHMYQIREVPGKPVTGSLKQSSENREANLRDQG